MVETSGFKRYGSTGFNLYSHQRFQALWVNWIQLVQPDQAELEAPVGGDQPEGLHPEA
jgi:hypothetical protein